MKRVMEMDFAITEFHMYLDTHPNDILVANRLEEYRAKCKILKKEYESKYGPISANSKDSNRWAWIKSPWPWETTCENSLENDIANKGGVL